jgi:hypothetical protein
MAQVDAPGGCNPGFGFGGGFAILFLVIFLILLFPGVWFGFRPGIG